MLLSIVGLMVLMMISTGFCKTLKSECPTEWPNIFEQLNEKCFGDLTCEYGEECCCGKCYPSFVSKCMNRRWVSSYTDACLGAGSFGCGNKDPVYSDKYTVDCTERNYQDSLNYCLNNGWTIASFQSDVDINKAKDKVTCNVYIGATSDGNGNWRWNDASPWWAYTNNDGLLGTTETKIVWRASDNKWNDWGKGDELAGVICKMWDS